MVTISNDEWMKDFIRRRTYETWDQYKKPYYLSFVSTDLTKEGVDYRLITAPLRLRQWAAINPIQGTQTVAHPIHKAKFGFVPEGIVFSFDEKSELVNEASESSKQPPRVRPGKIRGRVILVDFLEALARIAPEEIASVQIPVSVLVRFVKD